MKLSETGYYSYDNKNGLSLKRFLDSENMDDPWGENEPLNIQKLRIWSDISKEDLDQAWTSYVNRCKSGKGWFSRWKGGVSPYHENFTRTNSHDNLKAVCYESKDDAREIANVLVKKLCTYNDVTKKIDFKEFMRPDALVYAWLRSNSKLHNVLGLITSPILIAFILGSTLRKKDVAGKNNHWWDFTNASGKWLAKMMLDSLDNYLIFRLLGKFFESHIKKSVFVYKSFDENGSFDRVISGFKAIVYDFNMKHRSRADLDVRADNVQLKIMLDEYRSKK